METIDRYKIESTEKWSSWIEKIPFLKFPSDWEIKIIPPFAGAMARFQARLGKASVSVYLDVYENLGFFGGEPYWEIYPYNEDIYRVHMDDTDELIKRISESFIEQK